MEDVLSRIRQYKSAYAISARGHYLASARQARRNRLLGVPSLIISTIVGASIFGTIQSNPELQWRIVAGLLSLSAAVLASLQTFFGFAEASERHLAAGRRYGVVRRRLDLLELKYAKAEESQRTEALSDLDALLEELKTVAEESPAIPNKMYTQAEREFHEQELDKPKGRS